jgi:uncharacterized protein YbjT (DUF2867 family)
MGKTAIILGATGLTGSLLFKKLIDHPNFDKIKLFSRKSINSKSEKVEEHLGDLLKMSQFKSEFKADIVFCCIGTTAAKTKDKQAYKAIDYGIPKEAANLAKDNNISAFMVISALGANSDSSVFYNKTKGEMEEAVLSNNIKNTYILRPSLIEGNRNESRLGEKIGSVVMKIINPLMIGKLRKYRAIEADMIASAMVNLSENNYESQIIESDKIIEISR